MATLRCLSTSGIRSAKFSSANVENRARETAFLAGRLMRSSSGVVAKSPRTSGGSRVKCMVLDTKTEVRKKTLLHDLYDEQRQSPWYDNLSRPITDLQALIESGIRGVTSNPTIFQKAISSSDAYDEQFRQLIKEGNGVEDAYWGLVVKDIQDASEYFLPIYTESKGEDGYVSVEVAPKLAHETEGTIAAAQWLHTKVDRPNVHIKIPATADCVQAIKKVISLGISVNITLIFSLQRYENVVDAYLEGLEAMDKWDLSQVSSVASFFVSRVDTVVDKRLEQIGTEEALALRGKAATAQAALAFQLYQEKFSGPRWEFLSARGAKKQRLLWASTSVKNPSYPDTHYVSPLIGPETINTMPAAALQAFLDHGTVARTIDADVQQARDVYGKIEELGIHWSDVASLLEMEGLESFQKSFDDLLETLGKKGQVI